MIISLYADIGEDSEVVSAKFPELIFLDRREIDSRGDFAPGMKTEALQLLDCFGIS